MINQPARGKTCDTILGIVEEGKKIIKDFEESQALELSLPAGVQVVEHYEISRYSTLRTSASPGFVQSESRNDARRGHIRLNSRMAAA
jgi:ferritin-like metal-binding protein YciE